MTPKFTQRNSAATAMKIQTSSDLKPKTPRKKTEAISNQSTKLLNNRTTSTYVTDKEVGDKVYERTPYQRTSETGTKTTKNRLIGGRTVEKSNTKNTYAEGTRTNVARNVNPSNNRPVEKEQYDQDRISNKYNVSTKVIKDKKGNVVRTKRTTQTGTEKPAVRRTRG